MQKLMDSRERLRYGLAQLDDMAEYLNNARNSQFRENLVKRSESNLETIAKSMRQSDEEL